jgi:hypothetical protein
MSSAEIDRSRTRMARYPLKRDPEGTFTDRTSSRVTRSLSRFGPRRRRGLPLLRTSRSVTLSMPEGLNGGRGGRFFSRAISRAVPGSRPAGRSGPPRLTRADRRGGLPGPRAIAAVVTDHPRADANCRRSASQRHHPMTGPTIVNQTKITSATPVPRNLPQLHPSPHHPMGHYPFPVAWDKQSHRTCTNRVSHVR